MSTTSITSARCPVHNANRVASRPATTKAKELPHEPEGSPSLPPGQAVGNPEGTTERLSLGGLLKKANVGGPNAGYVKSLHKAPQAAAETARVATSREPTQHPPRDRFVGAPSGAGGSCLGGFLCRANVGAPNAGAVMAAREAAGPSTSLASTPGGLIGFLISNKGASSPAHQTHLPVDYHGIGRRNAALALDALAPPDPDHPYSRYVDSIRKDLATCGLPTDARGVSIHIIDTLSHGESVARTVAGPVGLAQGADLHLVNRLAPESTTPPKAHSDADIHSAKAEHAAQARKRFERVVTGEASLDELTDTSVDRGESILNNKQKTLATLVGNLPSEKEARTTLVNMSFGQSVDSIVRETARSAEQAPVGSPLHRELADALGVNPRQRLPGARLEELLTPRIASRLNEGEGKDRLDRARQGLANEVAEARHRGVLVFQAAGNDFAHASGLGDSNLSKMMADGVPGILSIGALGGKDLDTVADDEVAFFSSAGTIAIAAVGVGVPVQDATGGRRCVQNTPHSPEVPADQHRQTPGDASGTSYASPIALSIAALMLKANPDLTPDGIEAILTHPDVARDIPGTDRDGAGSLDPVRAVEMAASQYRRG